MSIERNDHLNSHKFFQIAISLMPFNQILWTMVCPWVSYCTSCPTHPRHYLFQLKNYETSINHEEHLSQIRHFYCHTLHMVPSNLFLTDNASIWHVIYQCFSCCATLLFLFYYFIIFLYTLLALPLLHCARFQFSGRSLVPFDLSTIILSGHSKFYTLYMWWKYLYFFIIKKLIL